MSAATASSTAVPLPRPAPGSRFPVATGSNCPKCGSPYHRRSKSSRGENVWPDDAQRRITELETQVRMLTDKATAAVDKLADYEDELRQLKSDQRQSVLGNQAAAASDSALAAPPPQERPQTPANQQTTMSRLGSLLGARKSVTNLSPGRSTSPTPPEGHTRRESDLEAALAKEQQLRQKAEGQASKLSSEVEDLSATLFQQANEMVATERKARAKLEERVEVLEKRDGEKRKRLERLEGAVQRIERVRGLLDVP